MDKQLSISIAAYNVENYLENTLESFICEERIMQQLEVIIVNDGSKDKTTEVAKKYVTKYPETFVLIDKENGGYGSTINASLPVAKGRYYKLVDGDDWVDTKQLSRLIEYLNEEKSDLVLTRYVVHDEETGVEKVVTDNLTYDSIIKNIDEITLGKDLAMHQIAFKTDLLRSINMKITENCFYTDFEYVMKPLPFIQSVTCYDLAVYIYRIGREGQSVQLSSWFKNIDQGLRVSINLAEYYEGIKNDIKSEKMRKYIKDSISDSAKNKYTIITMMPKETNPRNRVSDYNEQLKSTSKEIYNNVTVVATKKWAFVIRFMRLTHFRAFYPINMLIRRHNREKIS